MYTERHVVCRDVCCCILRGTLLYAERHVVYLEACSILRDILYTETCILRGTLLRDMLYTERDVVN